MSYRRALCTRWSRRDRLAVLVVAVTVAFLTGTALLTLAAGDSTTAIAAEYDAAGAARLADSPAAARANAPDGALVLPVARADRGDGREVTVVGVPPDARAPGLGAPIAGGARWNATEVPTATLGTVEPGGERPRHRLRGAAGTVTVAVERREAAAGGRPGAVFPDAWYVTGPEAVAELGADGALVIESADRTPERGVPLRSALAFFLAGARELVGALAVLGGVGATLVGVTVFGVTRTTVRDRRATVRVLRATGATPRQVYGAFLGRAALVLALGIAAGYAGGVIATEAAVNVAVAAGLPTSLSVAVTPTAAGLLGALYLAVLSVGLGAAALAIRPLVNRPPAALGRDAPPPESDGAVGRALGGRLPALQPTVLDWRALVPTTATLTAFVAFLLVVTAFAATGAPMAGGTGATVTEPGSAHPFASRVPADYATALRANGIAASPEILLFELRDGQPYPARGANYTAFAELSGATLVRGREPHAGADGLDRGADEPRAGRPEAVVGADLASTLGVDVGDRLLLGGSTQTAVAEVTVAGVFTAPGAHDDQLVVPLSTARHLHGLPAGTVQFVRAARLPAPAEGEPGPDSALETVAVTDVRAPATAVAGRPVRVRATLRNDGLAPTTVEPTVAVGGSTARVRTTIPAGATRTVETTLTAPRPGTYDVTVGGDRSDENDGTVAAVEGGSIRVLAPDAIRLAGLPARAPPGSEPRARVLNATGAPIPNATVEVGDRTVATGRDGTARVPLAATGETAVTATRGGRNATATVAVREGTPRRLRAQVSLSPTRPGLREAPTVRVALANPWNVTASRTLVVAGPGGAVERAVRLAPGENQPVTVTLPRRPPGRYEVTVRSAEGGEGSLAATTYRVTGDERVLAALATGGHAGTTGVGQAVAVAFGNLELVLAVVLGLGGAMAVGAATAAFAQAIHARRRTVGVRRATGATPRQVGGVVLADALRVGTPAVLLALVLGAAAFVVLASAGVLTVYGVRVATWPDATVLAAVAAGGLAVVLVGAGAAVLGLLWTPPAALLSDGDRSPPERGTDAAAGTHRNVAEGSPDASGGESG